MSNPESDGGMIFQEWESSRKLMTTPRMELTAAVLAARVDQMLSKEMHMELEKSLFWTDSMTVLRYIPNESRFQTFVANP